MVRRRLEQKFILKELLTQGFVPISQFRMKTKTGWYAYIITNQKVYGEHYIYPEHFAHDCRANKKGYRFISEVFSGIGQEGYTRIYYTAYKNGYAK